MTIKKVLEDFMLENFFPKSPNPFGLQFLFTSIECFWHLACAGFFQACLLCMILCCCCCCCCRPPPPTPSSTRQILKARVSVHKERNFEKLKRDLLWSVYRGNRMKTNCRAICTPARRGHCRAWSTGKITQHTRGGMGTRKRYTTVTSIELKFYQFELQACLVAAIGYQYIPHGLLGSLNSI